MKAFNKFVITSLLLVSFNANASISSVVLNDNSIISAKDISAIYLQLDESIDFIELNDGSLIEEQAIQSINFNFKTKLETKGAVRTGGDGSGG